MTRGELEDLYRKYGPLIYARCRKLLGDDAAAEDATQETFIRVHRHLASAPGVDEAVPWIYRIATNYCLNEVRNRSLRPQPSEALPEQGEELPLEARLADAQLCAALVRQAPEKWRACAWLHYVDGLTQEEVAQVLGISRRSVVTYLAGFLAEAREYVRRSAR